MVMQKKTDCENSKINLLRILSISQYKLCLRKSELRYNCKHFDMYCNTCTVSCFTIKLEFHTEALFITLV